MNIHWTPWGGNAPRSDDAVVCRATNAVDGNPVDRSGEEEEIVTRSGERGLTLAEMAIALMIISILSVIGLGMFNGRIERAKLARCYVDIRSIQSTLWSMSDGIIWPERAHFWNYAWAGKKPGPYYYFPNSSDPNRGHGNDMDFCDEENPGQSSSNRDCMDITFVVICQHNHRHLANYVYIEDEGPPTLAGWGRDTDPGYDKFLNISGNNPRPR